MSIVASGHTCTTPRNISLHYSGFCCGADFVLVATHMARCMDRCMWFGLRFCCGLLWRGLRSCCGFCCGEDFVLVSVHTCMARASFLLWFTTVARTSFLLRVLLWRGLRSCCCMHGSMCGSTCMWFGLRFCCDLLWRGLRSCCGFCCGADFVLAAAYPFNDIRKTTQLCCFSVLLFVEMIKS